MPASTVFKRTSIRVGSVLFPSFPQIHPSPTDLKQLSVFLSCLLSDKRVCQNPFVKTRAQLLSLCWVPVITTVGVKNLFHPQCLP